MSELTANTQDGAVPSQEPAKKKNKFLSAAFNIAAGVGAAYVAKTVAVAAFASCLPAVGMIAVSSAAVGAAVATTSWYLKKREAQKTGAETPKFWSKDTGKNFLFSSAFALVGGSLFTYFTGGFDACTTTAAPEVTELDQTTNVLDTTATVQEPVVEDVIDNDTANANDNPAYFDTEVDNSDNDVVVTETNTDTTADQVATIIPAAGFSCGDAVQSFKDAVGGAETTSRVAESLSQASKGSAQGIKDLGYFLFNGFDGVTENKELAVEFFRCAAEQGNVQAQVDLAYAEYHGLGTDAQPEAALEAMQNIENSSKAEWFVQQWTGQSASAGMKP